MNIPVAFASHFSNNSDNISRNYCNQMGNKADCSQNCDELANQKTRKASAYGNFQLLVNKDREYAVVLKTIDKHTITKKELEVELQRRKNIKSPHLISLCAYQVIEDINYIDFKLQYEYISVNLADKLKIWRQMNKTITQNQISNIMLGVQQALHQLYNIGIGHRCINFQTVLCFNSLYKLSDISMVTCKGIGDLVLTGYDLARQGDQNQFLSNNLLQYLYYQGTQPQYQIEDDLFSLALLTLAIVLDCKPKDFYIKKLGQVTKINRCKIDEGLKAMSLYCSPWLVKKVKGYVSDGFKQQSSTGKQSSSRKISSFVT